MRCIIRLVTVIAVVLSLSQVVAAASPTALALSSVKAKAPVVVLPYANEINTQELATVKGEGLITAVTAAAAGAFGAALSFTADYCWDRYADDAVERWLNEYDNEGDADNNRSWEWNEFYSSTFKTASTAFIGGWFLP